MALFDPNRPKRVCKDCGGLPLWGLDVCRDCFARAKLAEHKSIKERLLDLEIAAATPHQHVENMRF